MKIIPIVFLKTLPAVALLVTCAKERDEEYVDEDQDYIEVQYGKHDAVTKQMAIENWELFLKEAHTSFLLTESNLHSLEVLTDYATTEERQPLRALQTSCSNRLHTLKNELDDRDESFDKELETYDDKVQLRNEAFKKKFKREMYGINLELENVLEEKSRGD